MTIAKLDPDTKTELTLTYRELKDLTIYLLGIILKFEDGLDDPKERGNRHFLQQEIDRLRQLHTYLDDHLYEKIIMQVMHDAGRKGLTEEELYKEVVRLLNTIS